MHDCQQQTMNDSELIKNQKHKPTKPFIAKNYQLDFHIHLVSMSKLKLVIYLNFIDQSKKKTILLNLKFKDIVYMQI